MGVGKGERPKDGHRGKRALLLCPADFGPYTTFIFHMRPLLFPSKKKVCSQIHVPLSLLFSDGSLDSLPWLSEAQPPLLPTAQEIRLGQGPWTSPV